MNTKNPLRGLLSFNFYSASSNAVIIAILALVLAAVLLITGLPVMYNFFVMIAIAGFPYVIMMGMGGKTSYKWERFQITMPLRRSDLVNAFYLSIFLTSIVGIPLVAIITYLAYILHEGIFDKGLIITFFNFSALFFSMPLLMAGLLFPLACTKVGESRGEALFTLCLFPAVANSVFVPMLGSSLGLPEELLALPVLVLALLVFVVSYFILRQLYAKMDF